MQRHLVSMQPHCNTTHYDALTAAMDSNGLLFAQKLSWRATNHNSSIFHRDTEAPPTAAQQRSGPCTVHRIPLHTSMPNFTQPTSGSPLKKISWLQNTTSFFWLCPCVPAFVVCVLLFFVPSVLLSTVRTMPRTRHKEEEPSWHKSPEAKAMDPAKQ